MSYTSSSLLVYSSRSLNIQTEELHQADCCNHIVCGFIKAYNSITSAHYNLPNNLLGCIFKLEESVFRQFGFIILMLVIQKLAYSYIQKMKIPLFQDIPKIFSKEHSTKCLFLIQYIDP